MEARRPGSDHHDGDDNVADQAQRDRDESEALADERDTAADEREAALGAREVHADAREAVQADRREESQRIMADADRRHDRAEARDSIAATRDKAASLHSFLHDDDYGPAHQARRSAAMDRSESKNDRTSAAADRANLADGTPKTPRTANHFDLENRSMIVGVSPLRVFGPYDLLPRRSRAKRRAGHN